ncbi:MAG: hypothetical protein C4292_04685, partial [Nitrososphaera sp.]
VKVDDETMKDASKQKIKQKHDRIAVSFIRPQPSSLTAAAARSDITMLIIADQAYSFAVEAAEANAGRDAAGALLSPQQPPAVLATYSNSESTVLAYCSMFENFWIQAEIERQNSIKQAYFRMFKGQKLRDEVYRRDWKLKEEGNDGAP